MARLSGKKAFKSMEELQEYLMGAIPMEKAMERIRRELIELIEENVYDAYNPEWYERTYDLLKEENWKIYKPWIVGKAVYSNLVYNKELTHNDELWQHGNSEYGSQIEVSTLLDLLTDKVESGDIFYTPPREDFLTPFVQKLPQLLEQYIAEECNKMGIDVAYKKSVIPQFRGYGESIFER